MVHVRESHGKLHKIHLIIFHELKISENVKEVGHYFFKKS